MEALFDHGMQVARLGLGPDSAHAGRTLSEIDFRNRFGLNVLAIERKGQPINEDLKNQVLADGDGLLVHGPASRMRTLESDADFQPPEALDPDRLQNSGLPRERLHRLRVPGASKLVGQTLRRSRLGDAVDVQILCIVRRDGTARIPTSTDRFAPEDRLVVSGASDMVSILLLQGLEGVFVETPDKVSDASILEDDQVGLVEVVLSPHSVLSGQTLRQLNFREKYGLSVLAIWRKGRAYRSDLGNMALGFGDALLLYGPWKKLTVLGREPNFLVLTETAQEIPRQEKAGMALAIMAGVLLPVIAGWLPVYIAVVIGAAVMIATGCLTMDEASTATLNGRPFF